MKKLFYALSCMAAVVVAGGCSDDDSDLTYQETTVDFAVSEIGMEGDAAEVGLKLSRAAKEAFTVTIRMSSSDVAPEDIVSDPALDGDMLVVPIAAGETTGSFTISKAEGRNPE